jgi:hypothetical protein
MNMLNPKYRRYAERLRELIEEGKSVAKLARPSSVGTYIQGEDDIKLHAWLTKTSNILEAVFGAQSPQSRGFRDVLPKDGIREVSHPYEVYPITGVLAGH